MTCVMDTFDFDPEQFLTWPEDAPDANAEVEHFASCFQNPEGAVLQLETTPKNQQLIHGPASSVETCKHKHRGGRSMEIHSSLTQNLLHLVERDSGSQFLQPNQLQPTDTSAPAFNPQIHANGNEVIAPLNQAQMSLLGGDIPGSFAPNYGGKQTNDEGLVMYGVRTFANGVNGPARAAHSLAYFDQPSVSSVETPLALHEEQILDNRPVTEVHNNPKTNSSLQFVPRTRTGRQAAPRSYAPMFDGNKFALQMRLIINGADFEAVDIACNDIFRDGVSVAALEALEAPARPCASKGKSGQIAATDSSRPRRGIAITQSALRN